MCTVQVIELDQDIMQSMIQALACALLNSPFKLKCLPVGVTILTMGDTYIVDPTTKQLAAVGLVNHKTRLAFNVDTEELLMSNLEQLQASSLSFT